MTSIGNYQMQVPPGVEKYWMWRLALQLERLGAGKPAAKLYRKALNPAFRHNYGCGPSFVLSFENDTFTAFLSGDAVVSGKVVTPEVSAVRPCLILGSGPSINEIDERCFHDYDIIATNGAILKCAKKGVQAVVHIVQDPNFIETSFGLFESSIGAARRLVLSSHVIAAIAHRKPSLLEQCPVDLLERINRAFAQPRLSPEALLAWSQSHSEVELSRADTKGAIGWSHDQRLGVFTGSTVAYSALQFAVANGYRDVYLGGVDFTWGASGKRFYAEECGEAVSHLDANFNSYILPSFVFADGLLKINGVRVKNLSSVSKLSGVVFG